MKRSMINNYAIFISAIMLVQGIMGISNDVIFKLMTTNRIHAVIHITLGITGILLGLRHKAQPFLVFIGVLLPLVGILRFIQFTTDIMVQLLNINAVVAVTNIMIGVFALLVVYVGKPDGYTNENKINI